MAFSEEWLAGRVIASEGWLLRICGREKTEREEQWGGGKGLREMELQMSFHTKVVCGRTQVTRFLCLHSLNLQRCWVVTTNCVQRQAEASSELCLRICWPVRFREGGGLQRGAKSYEFPTLLPAACLGWFDAEARLQLRFVLWFHFKFQFPVCCSVCSICLTWVSGVGCWCFFGIPVCTGANKGTVSSESPEIWF